VVLYGMWALLAPQLESLEWTDVRAYSPSPIRLSLSLVLLIGFYLTHAFLWRRIVTDLGIGRPDPRTTVRVYFLASLGRYIPGKLWQVAGLALLSSRAGVSAGGATAAALLGQLGFLATGLLFVAVILPDWVSGPTPYILGFVLVSGAGLIWMITATPAGHNGREWLRGRLSKKGAQRVANALELADRMRARDAFAWALGYGLSWVLLGVSFSLFVTAFVPEAVAHNRLLAGTVAASYLAGYLVLVAPAGLGVREGAMTALLTAVPGFPVAAAIVVAVLSRVWFTLGELLPLALVPVLPSHGTPGPPARGTSGPPSRGTPASPQGAVDQQARGTPDPRAATTGEPDGGEAR
jgi:hypothetical protein